MGVSYRRAFSVLMREKSMIGTCGPCPEAVYYTHFGQMESPIGRLNGNEPRPEMHNNRVMGAGSGVLRSQTVWAGFLQILQ